MDRKDAEQALADVLDSEVPEGLHHLEADKLQELAELIEHARKRQQSQMRRSLEDALAYVPSLARGAIKRILFPKGDDA